MKGLVWFSGLMWSLDIIVTEVWAQNDDSKLNQENLPTKSLISHIKSALSKYGDKEIKLYCSNESCKEIVIPEDNQGNEWFPNSAQLVCVGRNMSKSKFMDTFDFQFHTTNKPVRSLPQDNEDNENICKTLVMSKTNPCSVSQERCLMKSYNNSSELVPEYFWLIETAITSCGVKEQYYVQSKNNTLSCVSDLSEVTLEEKHSVVVKLFGRKINLKMTFFDILSKQKEKLQIEISTFPNHTFMNFGNESSLSLQEEQTTFYVFASNNTVNITWPPFNDIFSIGNIPNLKKIKLINAKKNNYSKIVATLKWSENADIEAFLSMTIEKSYLIPIIFGGSFLGVLALLGACFCCASIKSSNTKKDLQPKIDVLTMERTQESNSSDYIWEISHDNDYYHG